MNDEDALNFLIQWLRDPSSFRTASYGYDLYIPNVLRTYVESHESLTFPARDQRVEELSPHFYAAAWELCRRGIIRPGIRRMRLQSTEDGSAGNGYSVTPFGRTWLAESDRDDFVPTEPGRFAAMLKPYTRFGSGFYERAQEAVRCYGSHAYLACCAMCGAAAESILLAIATAKKSEAEVLRLYTTANGRSKVENLVIGQAKESLLREFRSFTSTTT